MKLVSGRSRLVVWTLVAMLFFACKKDKDNNQGGDEKPGHIPGMGDDTRAPEGALFKLPAGVSLVGEIKGRDGVSAPVPDACVNDGVGEAVIVSMTLQNDSTGAPQTVEFPPGLVIVTASEFFQGGLLVERVVVTIPPKPLGPGTSRCKVILRLLCLNKSKNPSEEFVAYNWGPVTNSPLLKDLIKRLSGKKMLMSQYPNDPDWDDNVVDVVQHALWSLTDGNGLTDDDMKDINDLPNK
jgi:hypothetical protein